MVVMSLIELKEAALLLQKEIKIQKNEDLYFCCECGCIGEESYCEVCE